MYHESSHVSFPVLSLVANSSWKWYSSDKMLPKWSQDSQGGTAQGTAT